MENTIKAGDVVSLKAQPKFPMTVEYVNDEVATCVWIHPTTQNFIRQDIDLVALSKS